MSQSWRSVVVMVVLQGGISASAAQWAPAHGPLATKWAKDVSPSTVHREYPRPQMVRSRWQNLNGLWDFAIQGKEAGQPASWNEKILVPFPVESALSGVMKRPDPSQRVWYRRRFDVPAAWKSQRILLHFGAVDWEATVWVNGKELGTHRGGYDPFSCDVTDALGGGGSQEIVIAVWDPTDAGPQPRGKQVQNPGGILYTPSTGIWQTVWLEPVPKTSISALRITPNVDAGRVEVGAEIGGPKDVGSIVVSVFDGKDKVASAKSDAGVPAVCEIPQPKLWSPTSPFLYDLRVELFGRDGRKLDEVSSYFGMRKISIGRDESGRTRLLLNGKPLFMAGPLDQGFWPDGLYTAPTDAALRYDLEVTKRLGFNLIRKHVKVEPARWYSWCDKLGIVVWQDMPSGDTSRDTQGFERELREMVATHINNPSIVMWVVFNEGWGQHDTPRFVNLVRKLDPTRLIDNASGWTDQRCGDVMDIHVYPGPGSPQPEPRRAAVLGEFGGLGLPIAGHAWQEKDNWGYQSFPDREKLTDATVDLFRRLRMLVAQPGLSAAVYTQTTDVETESNGLMTYDRALIKCDPGRLRREVEKLYLPPPIVEIVVPTSERAGIAWRWTTRNPGAGWAEGKFDDSAWSEGLGGFGTRQTPGAVVRTEWATGDIWIRRTFSVPRGQVWASPHLLIHHDEDAEVFVDGKLLAKPSGFTTAYALVRLPQRAAAALSPGKHTLAVHCRQTAGGQYIDVGFVNVKEEH